MNCDRCGWEMVLSQDGRGCYCQNCGRNKSVIGIRRDGHLIMASAVGSGIPVKEKEK